MKIRMMNGQVDIDVRQFCIVFANLLDADVNDMWDKILNGHDGTQNGSKQINLNTTCMLTWFNDSCN